MMKVELQYSNIVKDVEKYLQWYEASAPVRKQKRILFCRYQLFSLIIVLIAILSEGLGSGIGVFILLNCVYFLYLKRRLYQKMHQESLRNLISGLVCNQEKTLILDDSGMSCLKEGEMIKVEWHLVDRVFDNAGDLYFFQGPLLKTLIPDRAFGNESDRNRVADIVHKVKGSQGADLTGQKGHPHSSIEFQEPSGVENGTAAGSK
jgi:hypothetical protein